MIDLLIWHSYDVVVIKKLLRASDTTLWKQITGNLQIDGNLLANLAWFFTVQRLAECSAFRQSILRCSGWFWRSFPLFKWSVAWYQSNPDSCSLFQGSPCCFRKDIRKLQEIKSDWRFPTWIANGHYDVTNNFTKITFWMILKSRLMCLKSFFIFKITILKPFWKWNHF